MFELTSEQSEKIQAWRKEHECKLRGSHTAIGGQYTFKFTPTGLGHVQVVECACGAEIDVTEYDDW